LVTARTAMKNRMNDHERVSKVASDALSNIIQTLAGQVEALDEAIQGHLKAHPELGRQVRLYMTIQGIGIVTSTVVLAEMGDLRRFERSRKLAAFAGVSPKLKDSGTSVHGKPRMCKQGSARVRTALYMAASNAIQSRHEGLLRAPAQAGQGPAGSPGGHHAQASGPDAGRAGGRRGMEAAVGCIRSFTVPFPSQRSPRT
jgi:transposase